MSESANNAPCDENPSSCLSCGNALKGPFCHHCGQEDTHYVRGIGSLITEFFGEMGNWDGRVWRTLIPLFLRPAFLSNEYVRGRRVPYVPPLRLYLFISIVAFIFFSQLGSGLAINGNAGTPQEIAEATNADTNILPELAAKQEDQREISGYSEEQDLTSFKQSSEEYTNNEAVFLWLLSDEQNAELNEKLKVLVERPKILVDKFFTVAPQMMLIMLPIFAFFLKVLYLGSKRYYIEHVVLALHTHAFMLITLLIILGVNLIHSLLIENNVSGWLTSPFSFLLKGLWFWLPVYLFMAQKRFYRQSFFVTFIKFNLTALFYLFLLTVAIAFGVIWSIWSA
ncbi:DUF3667 domain-containing protein [Aliidiomarina iranensis]|nr:DUF3667 domain-containing protein [Aliidiomarina iranensis]